MIVMKFGGSSTASPAAIKQVVSIVHSHLQCKPIVVVSALGDTTDHLLEILEFAARAESYLCWKLQEELKTYHFCIAEDLLGDEQLSTMDQFIRQTFRDLHVRMLEVCDGESAVTPELRDWVASLGEKLSSRMIAAVLQQNGIDSVHMESEKLILTDDNFTNAGPQYWETYARIRWSVPFAAQTKVVVLGGFIGSTEDGRTTTLGRGGSDLTASIVGAAVNATEIHVWKDVDGMLTWNPKIKSGGYRVRNLSYDEANELARAGATILHPETIAPAQRLRIPIIVRNTFRPDGDGTKIGFPQGTCLNPVKSIACRTNLTVVELRSLAAGNGLTEYSSAIERFCHRQKSATLLAASDEVIYVAVESSGRDSELSFPSKQCMQVHLRTRQAILTLVGPPLKRSDILERLSGAFQQRSALILPQDGESCSVRILIPQEELSACTEILQQIFFAELDVAFFAAAEPVTEQELRSASTRHLGSQETPVPLYIRRFAYPGLRP